MVAVRRAVLIGRESHVVLGTEFLDDAGIDLVDGLFFRHFKHPSTSFFRDAFKNLLSVDTRFFWSSLPSATTSSTAAGAPATTSRPTTSTAGPSTTAASRPIAALTSRSAAVIPVSLFTVPCE